MPPRKGGNSMTDRIKVKINHHPVSYRCIELFGGMFVCFLLMFAAGTSHSIGLMIGSIIITIAVFGVGEFFSAINGYLSVYDEAIHFRYIKYESSIPLGDITEISYGVYTEYAGRMSTKRIALNIKTSDGEEHSFNDKINEEELASSLDRNSKCNVPIIRMYRFLAERLPDKAKGYVKPESIGDML